MAIEERGGLGRELRKLAQEARDRGELEESPLDAGRLRHLAWMITIAAGMADSYDQVGEPDADKQQITDDIFKVMMLREFPPPEENSSHD